MTNPFDSAGSKAPPKPFTVSEGRREVRSFVLRQGRFTPAQQRAFDERWPRFGIDYNGQPAGYVVDPKDVVNYVENHDNQTLFDNNIFKAKQDTRVYFK